MKWGDVLQGKYLKKEDIDRPMVVKVINVTFETMKGFKGEETKAVLHFAGMKPMVLNKTCVKILKNKFGDEPTACIGHNVEVYKDDSVVMGNDVVGGLRIRIPVVDNFGGNGHSNSPVVLSWEDAQKRCAEVGVSREQLIAKLKARGNPAYNAQRDTLAVLEIVSEAKRPKDESFGDSYEGPVGGEEVPLG